jgi:hypothetical protein
VRRRLTRLPPRASTGLHTRPLRRAARLLGAARALVDSGLQPAIPFSEPLNEHTLDTLGTLEHDELEALMAEGREDAASGDFLKPDYVGAAASA